MSEDINTRAVLKVNGRSFKKWKSINVDRSIAQITGSFSFTTSNKFAGENEKWEITTGDKCVVEIAGQKVVTGYIDDIDDGYDIGSHNITFSGRDKTADLVDCNFDIFTNESEFKNQTFIQIIKKLCSPFGVTVELDLELLSDTALAKPMQDYKVETGQKVFEQIAILCQQYAVLPITTGEGILHITRAGLNRAFDTLESGKNIKANKLKQSDKNRYSIYYTITNGGNTGTAFNTKLIAEGKETDEYIEKSRDRPLIISIGEQVADDGGAQKRADWESRIRAGGSRKVETVVKGWVQSTGDLWPLNGLVQEIDKKIGIDGVFLIAGINLNLDGNGGELTTMSLVHPDTFVLKNRVPIKANNGLNAYGKSLKK